MTLNLSVIKSPAGVSLPATQKTFSEQGGTIGRGDSNDWVLSDPDRFLSSKHCALSHEGGQYFLTDTSTNGTFINSAPEPLGKGGKIPLNNGDTIDLGDYQFRVDLQSVFAMPDMPDVDAAPPLESPSDPFGASLEDPFNVSGAQPASSFDDPFATSSAFGASAAPVSLNPDAIDVDPLAALDKAAYPESGASAGMGHASPAPPTAGDYLGGLLSSAPPAPAADVFSSNSVGDGAGALNQAVDWPSAKNESAIPEDWEDDLMGSDSPVAPPPQDFASPPPANAIPQPPPSAHLPLDDFLNEPPLNIEDHQAHQSLPLTDPPKMPVAPRPSPRPQPKEPLLSERPPERVDAFAANPEPPVQHAAPVSPQQAPQQPKPTPAKAPVAQRVGNELLDGLGLSERDLSDEQAAHIHQAIGELMPVIINGMMQILRSRASIKNEFRMNVTTIQPVENNPLKFSADAGEAIENLFLRQSSAYKQPVDAFQEGFDGIGEHQVAIIAGIRAAFKSMMDRFNPSMLEKQFDKQNKGVVLPGMQKAKYWNSYTDYYTGFVDNMENTFQYLFGDEFVQAYEEQLRRLAAERKKNKKTR